ncbi:MAG TPA: TlpA family protein disulfide reductase, partial [Bacteroidia bacterium]|nr:TlpA family protein disulfide reductase [Bacteroidia bacterium]
MKLILTGLLCLASAFIQAQNFRSIPASELISETQKTDDTLYVMNFWATWCKPCIEELPAFEDANSIYQTKKVKITLINLDFNSRVNDLVLPFIERKNL